MNNNNTITSLLLSEDIETPLFCTKPKPKKALYVKIKDFFINLNFKFRLFLFKFNFLNKPNLNKSNLFLVSSPVIIFFITTFSIVGFMGYILMNPSFFKKDLKPSYNVYTSKPNTVTTYDVTAELQDARAEKVKLFFNKHNAPLASYSQYLVDIADAYDVDWRLVPAIGFCEGNGGKQIPEGSFNTWGWAASQSDLADKSGRYNLGSWENAINIVTKGLKIGYIDKGLTTPEEIMKKYAPPSVDKGGPWAKCVNLYMSEIEDVQ
ncbi:hypothetical protein COV24_00520 [candidate division WWE3 bacterium CG10_big_fil_rev_8_21_14_0_10_32_10]|uniref:Mannosyl-glycoprotein endo-beta-N-acetylglucosamidase-like domain-containing protein n=1 Tax=candidate division WWE3 bacterium CG10_big_fil_rev_8_21_14_0_10_32_10 TaxID=1975090 RepID=A0A2H0RBK7_UNCKA|nr:MAG: hypothetical protein COV24_00520 [candidate division WWE3 bacterium CG10_big_fil_rev_8_21_14_0_10_32_10]